MNPDGTNPNDSGVQTPVVDDDKPVSEEDLRDLKYPKTDVETPTGEDEPAPTDDDTPTDDSPVADEDQNPEIAADPEDQAPDGSFVKEFPNIKGDTPEEYAKNLEIAYQNSTAEALRLKNQIEPAPSTTPVDTPAPAENPTTPATPAAPADPLTLFAKQEMDKQIDKAYTEFRKDYSQVEDTANYQNFSRTVGIMSKTILETEGRLASPEELYGMAATALKWEKTSQPTEKERLAMTVKNNGSSASPSSASNGKVVQRSKVTQAMIDMNKKMYPGKSDDEIRKELEPYV